VGVPKHFKELLKRDDSGIIINAGDFRMAGIACANFFVCRVFGFSTGIAGIDPFNATELLKNGFYTPKTPGSKGCGCLFR
jgi:hypothetical protein